MRFHVTHRKGAKFARRGLRSYFEYRDLGIKRATGGKVVAHVIRARPAQSAARRMARARLPGAVRLRAEGLGAVRVRGRRPGDDEGRELLLPAAEYPPSRDPALAQPGDDRGGLACQVQDLFFGETCSQKVTGPSLTRLTFMWAPKRPVATRAWRCLASATNTLKQPLAFGRRSAAREARPRAAVRIRDEGELRDHEQPALHVLHRKIHLARRVREDPVAQHALGEARASTSLSPRSTPISASNARADLAHGFAADGDARPGDALNKGNQCGAIRR